MNAPYRVVLNEMTTSLLRSLTTKTGLSANVLSRFAMLISFEESDPPAIVSGKSGLIINRTTLFGELEPFLMSAYALRSRAAGSADASKDLSNHIARGAAYLNVRVNSITELLAVVHDLS